MVCLTAICMGAFQPAPDTYEVKFNISCGPSTTLSACEESELFKHSRYMICDQYWIWLFTV